MKTIKVLLADDHQLVRAGIGSLLRAMPEVEVIGEATDGREVVTLAAQCKPAIIFMDIGMRNMNGLEALQVIKAHAPHIKVVILSMHATYDYVQQALRGGASGYLIKDSATLELELAIRAVMRGETYFSPTISSKAVAGVKFDGESDAVEQLTPRQTQILRLLAFGKSTKEIAYQLEVSAKTVETHRAQIMERLGIRDLPGLVRFAIRIGLVDVGD